MNETLRLQRAIPMARRLGITLSFLSLSLLSLLNVLPALALGGGYEFQVIQAEVSMDPEAGEAEANNPDFYINGGSSDGLEVAAILDVYRPTTVHDPFKDSEHEIRILIGQVKVIRLYEETAIVRVHFLESSLKSPVLTYRTVMVGDYAVPREEDPGDPTQISLPSSVLFDFDRWQLRAEAREAIDTVYDMLARYPDQELVIEGHTCSVGNDAYNQGLSLKRAKSVADYLKLVKGVPEYRIHVVGYGKKFPTTSNDTEKGREKNRRVDFRITPPGTFTPPPDPPAAESAGDVTRTPALS